MKNIILLTLLILTQVFGDLGLSKGMKEFGEVQDYSISGLQRLAIYLLTNHWIWLGVISLIVSLLLYLSAISRLDLSYVLPVHASSYVVNSVLAYLILNENIPLNRWLSTALITLGVVFVSLSKNPPANKTKPKSDITNFPLFMLPFGLSKTWLAIIVISFADATGDLSLAKGMKQIGRLKFFPVSKIFFQLTQIITNPFIITGITAQTVAFIALISVLSWADISFVRPATALTYIISMLGSKFFLQEKIPLQRLIGIIFIGAGITVHR